MLPLLSRLESPGSSILCPTAVYPARDPSSQVYQHDDMVVAIGLPYLHQPATVISQKL